MKLVAYARFSSSNQREESITAQLRAIDDWASKNGHIIVKNYIDEAFSARTDNRPQFQQMIEDSKKATWDGIVIHKLDRFARNRYDSATYKRKLKLNGKILFSVTENLDDSPESIIMESVLEGMAEYYSANLAREVKKGLKENALNCLHNGGIPPLGYNVKNKKYVINEEEAKIVKLIFQLCKNGHSYREIAHELNSRGYKTKLNKDFAQNSIHDILKNEKYIGTYTFGYGSKAKVRDNPRNDMIKIENGMPAIIDKATFYCIQEKLKGRKKMSGSKRAKQVYILSGLIKCGKCNNSYVGARKNPSWSVYEDSGKKKGICENTAIQKEKIEAIVIDELKKQLSKIVNNSEMLKKVNDLYKEYFENSPEELEITNQKLSVLNNKINNINKAIIDGFYSPDMKEEMKNLLEQKEFLEEKIILLQNISSTSSISQEQINSIIANDYLNLDSDNLEVVKSIVQKYVKQIIITPDNISIDIVFESTNITGDITGGGEES